MLEYRQWLVEMDIPSDLSKQIRDAIGDYLRSNLPKLANKMNAQGLSTGAMGRELGSRALSGLGKPFGWLGQKLVPVAQKMEKLGTDFHARRKVREWFCDFMETANLDQDIEKMVSDISNLVVDIASGYDGQQKVAPLLTIGRRGKTDIDADAGINTAPDVPAPEQQVSEFDQIRKDASTNKLRNVQRLLKSGISPQTIRDEVPEAATILAWAMWYLGYPQKEIDKVMGVKKRGWFS